MSVPSVTAFFDEATFTVTYVVTDPGSAHAAIIDPVLDFDPASGRTSTASADAVAGFVRDNGLTVDWILETHVHADHLTAAPYLEAELGGRIHGEYGSDDTWRLHGWYGGQSERFGALIAEEGILQPLGETATSLAEAVDAARRIGFPVVVRPSYVLGGRGMAI